MQKQNLSLHVLTEINLVIKEELKAIALSADHRRCINKHGIFMIILVPAKDHA